MSNRLGQYCADDSDLILMGKWYLHASPLIFDRIIIKVAGNEDRQKRSSKFDFWPLVSWPNLLSLGVLDDIYFQSNGDIWKKNSNKGRVCINYIHVRIG